MSKMEVRINGQCEVGSVVIGKVKIGKIETKLEIRPTYSGGEEEWGICLDFGCGFNIFIDGRGISMQRLVKRPGHDHDNVEKLVEVPKLTSKALEWEDASRCDKPHKPLFIGFGPRTVDW